MKLTEIEAKQAETGRNQVLKLKEIERNQTKLRYSRSFGSFLGETETKQDKPKKGKTSKLGSNNHQLNANKHRNLFGQMNNEENSSYFRLCLQYYNLCNSKV